METILKWSGVVALVILAIMGLMNILSDKHDLFGTACSNITCIDGGLRITNGPLESDGDLTVSGGTVNVTTTNTATSTAVAGCFQTNATSTASVGHFVVGQSAISTSTFAGTVTVYPVFWQSGACPNL